MITMTTALSKDWTAEYIQHLQAFPFYVSLMELRFPLFALIWKEGLPTDVAFLYSYRGAS